MGGIFLENAVEQSVVETDYSRKKSVKWYKTWKFITTIIIIALILVTMSYYQASHFNTGITINGVKVNGLTADQALKSIQTSVLKNDVYVGKQLILDGKDIKMGFTASDLPAVKKLLKGQWTFFPSFKEKNYSLMPSKQDQYRSEVLKTELEQKLISMNQDLKAPKDAQAYLEEGKIIVSKSIDGKQYDVTSLLKDFENQGYTSKILLSPAYLSPIKEDSQIVKNEEKKLNELLQQTVEYKVQDQIYSLKASELIKNATVSKDLKVSIDPENIKNKIAEINESQSTLGKNFSFKTHSGSVISVKGQGYGWALNVDKETSLIQEALEKGEKSVSASNIYGNGWSNEGYGYETTTNNGIGDTYAEVSIAEQRIWIYRDGKLVVTTNVVTGKHSTQEDTSKGVWYILYKRTPYTLTGSSSGNPNYSIEVDYWAPFTNSGQGFHDAGWRKNWASNAYLTAGSGGCVNVSPSVMKSVYDNLSVYQPVVVY
ncbi:L,D-transpeptidase family protein [Metabacillus sp. FJAT-53654]|uniref:L,D-transpeptidase family protein n=1 Tax=Metabacillus rhizosphaerae TaxID=3117747 RepID=A0ABZ2MVC2_9BACI